MWGVYCRDGWIGYAELIVVVQRLAQGSEGAASQAG